MSQLNWRALIVEDEHRSAIYAETFPANLIKALAGLPDPDGILEAFETTAALEILATFAGAWKSLHIDANGHRWQYRSVITPSGNLTVLALRARTLDPSERWIVIDDVHRPNSGAS